MSGNDWNLVRHTLDTSANFEDLHGSPWYADAVYEKFSAAEYERRYEAARALMTRDDVEALLLCGSPNIYSHGGGVTWATGMIDDRGLAQYVILPRAGDPTLVYPHPGCHIEAIRKQVSIRDVRDGHHGQFGKVLAGRFNELGLQKGRIGIVAADRTGPEYMGVTTYLDLKQQLPDAEFVWMPLALHELSHRKSHEELRAVEKAGQLAIAALRAVAARAKRGVREYQLAAAATNAVMEGGGRVHLLMLGSTSQHDPKLIFPNPNPSSRVLQDGDIILAELAMSYMGYSAKIGHPISIGKPTQRYDEFFKKVVLPGYKAVRAELGPGNTLQQMQQVSKDAFRKNGAQSRPIIMHGIDLITSVPFVCTDEVKGKPYDMVMRPGMTYAIEITPVNSDGTFGLFFSRTFVITEGGVRELTEYPVDELIVAG